MGGAIYCDTCKLNISNPNFNQNQGYYGGVFYITDYAGTFIAQSLLLNNSLSYAGGGGFYLGGTSSYKFLLQNQWYAQNITSLDKGGLIYADNPSLIIELQNISMSNFSSDYEGGMLYIKNAQKVLIEGSNFTNFSSSKGSLMASVSSTVIINISKSIFFCNQKFFDFQTDLKVKFDQIPPESDAAGVFYIENTEQLYSQLNTFKYCYLCSQGGIFQLNNSVLYETSSFYYGNAALQGGNFYAENSKLIIKSA